MERRVGLGRSLAEEQPPTLKWGMQKWCVHVCDYSDAHSQTSAAIGALESQRGKALTTWLMIPSLFSFSLSPALSVASLQRKLSELWLTGQQGVKRQSGLSHRSPSSPDAERSSESGHAGKPAGWEWGPDGLLKREAPGGDREEAGTVQPQLLLSSAGNCPSPLLGSFRGLSQARCLPDFREGRNLVPCEVEGSGSEKRGHLCAAGGVQTFTQAPTPPPLVPWGREAKRREKNRRSVNQ